MICMGVKARHIIIAGAFRSAGLHGRLMDTIATKNDLQ